MEAYPFIDLNETQLRNLAQVIYNQEGEAIYSGIQFSSEFERAQYLKECRECHELAVGLLDSGAEIRKRFENDGAVLSTLGHEVYFYLISGANTALQGIGDYSLRLDYLKKFTDHSNEVINEVKSMDPQNSEKVQSLARDIASYRHLLMEYTRRQRKRNLSIGYSKWLKDSGITFENLIERCQAKLQLPGQFEDLKDTQKLEVYDQVISESGRGGVLGRSKPPRKFKGAVKILLESAGSVVRDIYVAEQEVKPDAVATRPSKLTDDAVVTGSGINGALVGASIVSSLASCFTCSGGSKRLSTDGIRCFVAPMPDVKTLAYQISHHHLAS